MSIDLSKPYVINAFLWGAVIVLGLSLRTNFTAEFRFEVLALVLTHIFSFFLIFQFLKFAFFKRLIYDKSPVTFSFVDLYSLRGFSRVLFFCWMGGYALNIFFSGGLPFLWVLSGDSRTYVDFGLPTFTGLMNIFRAFLFSSGILLFLVDNKFRRLLVPSILFLTCILEVSRGGMVVLLLHGAAVYFCFRRIRIGNILKLIFLAFIFISFFGLVADFRGGHGEVADYVSSDSVFLSLPKGFFWVYTYFVSPINNLNYAVAQEISPGYSMYFSLQSLIPSVIRDLVFTAREYPIQLANEAFNATTYYSPLFADFGIVGALFLVFMLQWVVAYIYLKGRLGSIVFLLMYPAYYMALVLSVFYMYYFSLIVVFYPFVSLAFYFYRNYCRKILFRKYDLMETMGIKS